MPSNGLYIQAAGKLAERIPGVRMIPVVRLIMAAEVLALGKHHVDRLTPAERARMLRLLRQAHGRPKNLNRAEQVELTEIVRKLEPRLFLADAGEKLSPVGIPSPLRTKIVGATTTPPPVESGAPSPWPRPGRK